MTGTIIELILVYIAHAAAGIYSSTRKYSKKITYIIWCSWIVLQTALLVYTESFQTNWSHQFFFGFIFPLVGQYAIFFVTTKGKLAQRIFTMLTYSIFFCIITTPFILVKDALSELHWSLTVLVQAILLLAIVFYYVVFAKTDMDAILVAIITFGLNTAAYIAELMRSALDATDKGQVEAMRTLGFSGFAAFRYVTLPQAAEIAKPVYQSTIINLIQWTSVVGYVTITDLTRVINNISARTMQPLFMIIVGMIIYLGLSYLVTGIFALSDLLKKRRGAKQ